MLLVWSCIAAVGIAICIANAAVGPTHWCSRNGLGLPLHLQVQLHTQQVAQFAGICITGSLNCQQSQPMSRLALKPMYWHCMALSSSTTLGQPNLDQWLFLSSSAEKQLEYCVYEDCHKAV